MSTATPGMSALVEELLGLLDEEIALLTVRRSQLEALSTVLVEGDPDANFHSMAVRMVEALRGERRAALARAEMLGRMGV